MLEWSNVVYLRYAPLYRRVKKLVKNYLLLLLLLLLFFLVTRHSGNTIIMYAMYTLLIVEMKFVHVCHTYDGYTVACKTREWTSILL